MSLETKYKSTKVIGYVKLYEEREGHSDIQETGGVEYSAWHGKKEVKSIPTDAYITICEQIT